MHDWHKIEESCPLLQEQEPLTPEEAAEYPDGYVPSVQETMFRRGEIVRKKGANGWEYDYASHVKKERKLRIMRGFPRHRYIYLARCRGKDGGITYPFASGNRIDVEDYIRAHSSPSPLHEGWLELVRYADE